MIKLKNVNKRYKKLYALKNFNLNISENGIYCLLGLNGAGKTTLMKTIAGYQNATNGDVIVEGKHISTSSVTTPVTYIKSFSKHFNMPVKKLIDLASHVNTEFDKDFAIKMMKKFELDEEKRFNKLSLGMKTMMSTIFSLASNKKIILLDEPVLGLDAIMRENFYELLQESYNTHPRIIIISTHLIEEISKSVQKLIIINNGQVIFFDETDVIDEKAYMVSGTKDEVSKSTEGLNIINTVDTAAFRTNYIFDRRIESEKDIKIQNMSLQDFFINLIKGGKK